MKKQTVGAGIIGGIVMFIWLFVTNAVLPFKSNLIHRAIPFQNQVEVHGALKSNITEPGTYSVPYLPFEEEDQFLDYRSQPVYSITYEGMTHGEGSPMTLSPFVVMFLVPIIAAWMLSVTSDRIQSKYLLRLLFVTAIGLIIVLFEDVLQMSFGPQAEDYLLFLAVNNLVCWILVGLVIAWRMKPRAG